jgi:hypothetical protein
MMDNEQRNIWIYLNRNAIGYSQRKTSTEIREACQLNSGGPTNEHIRDLIRDMILDHGCCIGSIMYKNGYWIIQNEEELNRATDSLERRAQGVMRRADALRNNWQTSRDNG